jgi:Lar family restriction alleviation protein
MMNACPFCGSTDLALVTRPVRDSTAMIAQMVCNGCGGAGPLVDGSRVAHIEEDAKRRWNQRPASPAGVTIIPGSSRSGPF